MTDVLAFRDAYAQFRAIPYPAYPKSQELRDWNSRLLALDAHVAGYAFQVSAGQILACDVPDLDSLVGKVTESILSLEEIDPSVEEDAGLASEYRSYVAALGRLVSELGDLASRGK
ncbi:hypothetical protein [Micromonospora sp. LOL_023]|uniref:hypothetical protein n=1 Tax=Micromonospora sp. LOL_023 TaxID=3345418 RepID=UPI003A8361BF